MTHQLPRQPRTSNRGCNALVHCILAIVLAILPTLGCSQKTQPAPGEVLLLLTTDMQVPESFDTVILNVAGTRHAYTVPGLPPSTPVVTQCDVGNTASTRLEFPTTIALLSERNEPTGVALNLTACKSGGLVFTKDFSATIPEPGQIKMLRTPIRWLCADRTDSCYGCSSSPLPCYHQSITRYEASKATDCHANGCDDPKPQDIFAVIEFREDEAAEYTGTSNADTNCFEPSTCFDMAGQSQFVERKSFPVPAGWQNATMGPCVATPKAPTDKSRFNLALVLAPGDRGFCDKYRCIVPLDAQQSVGWKWSESNEGQIDLPDAVCHMLDSGQILYVLGSEACASKSPPTPTCGKRPVDPPANTAASSFQSLIEDASVYLALDDAFDPTRPFLMDNHNLADLERVDRLNPAPTDMSSAVTVRNRAGKFNSLQYAKSRIGQPDASSYTLSAWVSLTEPVSATETVMPILSNLSADCRSGARLELRTCDDDSTVVLALGTPFPPQSGTAGQCDLKYTFAPLAAKSDRGGSFTPWQRGIWYHVAATYDDSGPTLYVDGTSADGAKLSSVCSFAEILGDQSSEKSFLYLGSQSVFTESLVKTRELLIDEVTLFDHALDEVQVKQLLLESSTVAGASGLLWGAWGTQDGSATVDPTTQIPNFTVVDSARSSAGSYALLAEPQDLAKIALKSTPPRLSDFDEAVLVASLPVGIPFQFALVAEHGKRQCTWQLFGKTDPNDLEARDSDSYVINLHRPSWCVDPGCSFDPNNVEIVRVGSDWALAQAPFRYAVKTVAFRKRPVGQSGGGVPQTPTKFGGIPGPGGWCWKPVAYDPAWQVEPVELAASLFADTHPVKVGIPQFHSIPVKHDDLAPELAADLADDLGSRDLTACGVVALCLVMQDDATGSPKTPELVLQNESGQTLTWPILGNTPISPDGCTWKVTLADGYDKWPITGKNVLTNAADVLESVTRISVRYAGSITVHSVKCCAVGDTCIGLDELPVSSRPN